MAKRNKTVQRLRKYRDQLVSKICDLEHENREIKEVLIQIRQALMREDTLRAYSLASMDIDSMYDREDFNRFNRLTQELTIIYRQLAVEREFTFQILKAAHARDLLRVLALSHEHHVAGIEHDTRLAEWGKKHGFIYKLSDNGTHLERT